MRRVRLLACVACLLWIVAIPPWAEGKKDKTPGNPTSPTKAAKASNVRHAHKTVALLDLNTLFKNDAGFKRQMTAFKADVDAAEANFKNEGNGIKILSDRLAALKPDSADYKMAHDELVKYQTDMQVRMQAQKQDFLQRESKIYYAVYQQIFTDVDKYAKENNYKVVLKFNSEPVNAAKPDDILRGINNPVIWHAEAIDITPAIAERLHQNVPGGTAPSTAGQQPSYPTALAYSPPSPYPTAPAYSGKSVDTIPPGVTPPPATAKKPSTPAIGDKEEDDEDDAEPGATGKAASPKKPDAAKSPASSSAAPKKHPAHEKVIEKKSANKKGPKKATVVAFTLKGEYPEGPVQPGLFAERQTSLSTLIQRMDQAAEDKNVAAVWLRIEDFSIGSGKVNELQAAVGRLRKAHKPVYAELASGDTGQYLLAAACDEVDMPPSGMLIVPGVRAEVTFYKGLLDKLGLQFDALKMGKYKGAVEPFTRTSMSGPLRESMEAIVDDSYEALVNRIAGDRRLKDYQVKTLLDQGLFSASAAQKAGLIDRVCYSDEFQDLLKAKLKVDEVEVVTNYKKKQVDTDFSGIGGLVKLIEVLTGGKPAEKGGTKKRVAVVYAVGTIVEGKGSDDMFGSSALGSTTLIEALRKAAEDSKVVAIVLRVDSPGGSATASDLIWREVVRSKKPVIASMGDVAASGGYYISMPARKIVAEPGTITGSIGVFGGKLVTKGLYDKLGMTTEVISRGANSGALSSSQPFTPGERKAWTELLSETYQQFVNKAAQGRKMNPQRLEKLAQGRVYTGRMAKKLGLVDELGTLNDAVVAAKQAAGLKADADVELLILPQPKSVFEQLFGDPSAASDLDSAMPEWFRIVRQAKFWQRLLGEKVLLWMPYEVRVR